MRKLPVVKASTTAVAGRWAGGRMRNIPPECCTSGSRHAGCMHSACHPHSAAAGELQPQAQPTGTKAWFRFELIQHSGFSFGVQGSDP